MVKPPAVSTVHAALDRHEVAIRRKRRRYKTEGTPLNVAGEPNGLWCADYKAESQRGNWNTAIP